MKFIKISVYSVFAIALIAIVAAVYFVVTFNANDYKVQISKQVKQQTGRELTLGDIKPSIFPWVGIELQQIALSNAQGFNESPMVQAERIDVRVELLPLLKQEIHLDTLQLYGLNLNLQKNEQGKTNWDDVLEKQQAASVKDNETTAATGSLNVTDSDSDRGTPLLKVNGIEIKNAQALWDDAQLGKKIALKELNVISGVVQLGESTPLKISANIQVAKPAVNLQIETDMGINYDTREQNFALNDVSLKLNAGLPDFDIEQLTLHVKTDVSGNLEKQAFTLPIMSLDIEAKGKAIPKGDIKANISAAIELDLLAQQLQLTDFTIQTLGLNLKSQLQVLQLIDAPVVQGHISISPFNLKTVLAELAVSLPEMKNDQALQMASIDFDVKADADSASFNPLNITLDKSILNGFISVNDFARPKIKYDLKLDAIHLDDYMPPVSNAVAGTVADTPENSVVESAVSKDEIIELPTEILRSLELVGSLNIGALIGFDQKINQLNIETLASNGLLKINKLDAKLLEGSVASSAQLDVRKNTPLYQVKLKADGIKSDSIVNPLLQEILGESAVSISGVSNMSLSLNTKGQTINQLTANSHGEVAFNADKAVMQGVDA